MSRMGLSVMSASNVDVVDSGSSVMTQYQIMFRF
jgi:hypothetical protein